MAHLAVTRVKDDVLITLPPDFTMALSGHVLQAPSSSTSRRTFSYSPRVVIECAWLGVGQVHRLSIRLVSAVRLLPEEVELLRADVAQLLGDSQALDKILTASRAYKKENQKLPSSPVQLDNIAHRINVRAKAQRSGSE